MLILIYGITGLVGQAAARAALTAGHQVRGLARNPDKIDRDLLERLEGFTRMDGVDDLPAFNRACENVDAVISACIALPDTAVVGQIHLLRAAERAGVKVFHGASWNIDWTELPIGYAEQYDPLILFYRFARLTSPLKLVFGFTGVILDYMFSYDEKFGPPIRKETRAATVIGEGNDIWTFTTVDDLAAYAVQAVSDPDATNEGLYYVASFQLTARDLFRVYEKVRGVQLRVESTISAEEAERKLAEARSKTPLHRHQEYMPLSYARIIAKKGSQWFDPIHSRAWGHIKPKSWEEWLEEHPEI